MKRTIILFIYIYDNPSIALQTGHKICPEIRNRATSGASVLGDRTMEKAGLFRNRQVTVVWEPLRKKNEGKAEVG